MCGIAAIIGNKSDYRIDLLKSLSKIKHRGNSYDEIEVFNGCALGANRLEIIDRENGRQPKTNEKKTIFAIQNGEIFNYKQIQKDLTKKGHRLQTNCDTEVLTHLWEEYGVKMIDKIDSEMFAFVIYDKEKHDFFVARDYLGVKPLYYAYDKNNGLHIASEIKQLVQFDDIAEVKEFPAGHYMLNGTFKQYYKITSSNKFKKKTEVKNKLKKLIEDSVKKRVQTDLPIGVFMSGGVDSSLIMELASRYHNDVTALILGKIGSSDFENAVRLCKERGYKYKIISPEINYKAELNDLIYYLETYEPHIIRHSFANNQISKVVSRLGFKIVLVGEGSDELFAGYNEFTKLSEKNINKGCEFLLKSMSKGNLMRIDKPAMRYTIEVRCPFFDKKIVDYALNIDGKLKIKKTDHRITVKSIFREVASDYLPKYIAFRYKAPFANGAGLNIGFNYKNEDGELARLAHQSVSDKELDGYKKKFPEYNFTKKEEILYFKIFLKNKFNKFKEDKYRLLVMANLIDVDKDLKNKKILVAEFDRLALYFPVYLAALLKLFLKKGLDVDFISTGGDDKTFATLIQNSAQIGLSDPMFAMIDNQFTVKGEIIGELVQSTPLYMVTFKPNVNLNAIKNVKINSGLHIGTYQIFSTTNTISHYLFKNNQVSAIQYDKIEKALYDGDIDIAVVTSEHAYNLEKKGAHIIYAIKKDLPNFLFTGFTISQMLEGHYKKLLPSFLQAVNESLDFIHKNKDKALNMFKKEFKNLNQPEKTFNDYLLYWNKNVNLIDGDFNASLKTWQSVYPDLLHDINPFVIKR